MPRIHISLQGRDPLEQLELFVAWERENNPPPAGKFHIAEWALREIIRLRSDIEAMTELGQAPRNTA